MTTTSHPTNHLSPRAKTRGPCAPHQQPRYRVKPGMTNICHPTNHLSPRAETRGPSAPHQQPKYRNLNTTLAALCAPAHSHCPLERVTSSPITLPQAQQKGGPVRLFRLFQKSQSSLTKHVSCCELTGFDCNQGRACPLRQKVLPLSESSDTPPAPATHAAPSATAADFGPSNTPSAVSHRLS